MRFARGRWRAAPNAVITVDTRPPVVTAEMPAGRTIAYGADGGNGVYRYTVRSDEPGRIWPTVFRVLPDGTVEQIWRPSEPVPIGAGTPVELTWPAASGSPDTPADDGTYLVGYEMRDAAGNVARLPTPSSRAGPMPRPGARAGARHHPVARDRLVRRPGPRRPAAPDDLPPGRPGRCGDRAACERRALAPARAGLYGLRVSGSTTTVWGWQPVAGRAATLVVLPTYTWQLANSYDANGDGFPDLAPAPLGLDRPVGGIARDGLDEVLRLSSRAMAAAGRPARSPTSRSTRPAFPPRPGSCSCRHAGLDARPRRAGCGRSWRAGAASH